MQGDFALHHKILNNLNVSSKSVKSVKDLQKVEGLILTFRSGKVIAIKATLDIDANKADLTAA